MRKIQINTEDLKETVETKPTQINKLIGGGRPKKNNSDKADKTITLYFSEKEIQMILKASLMNGYDTKDFKKYAKKIILKTINKELSLF